MLVFSSFQEATINAFIGFEILCWFFVGEIIGRGHNRREADADPTAHAEIVAIRAAAAASGDWRLAGCSLVVTLVVGIVLIVRGR